MALGGWLILWQKRIFLGRRGEKCYRCLRLTISPPSVGRLFRKYGIIAVSQPYWNPWPIKGIASLLLLPVVIDYFRKFNRRCSALMFFDPAITNEEQNELTLFLFSNLRLTYFLVLIPVISSSIQTFNFDLRPNTFEWLASILVFRKLKDSLSVHGLVTTLALLWTSRSSPYALFNVSNFPVPVFFNFTQNWIAALCSILLPSTLRKD